MFSINGNTNSHTNQCLKYNLQIYHTKSNFTQPPQIGLHSNVQNCDGCVTAKRSTGQHIGLQPNKHFEELWELNQRTQPPSEKLAPTTLHRTQQYFGQNGSHPRRWSGVLVMRQGGILIIIGRVLTARLNGVMVPDGQNTPCPEQCLWEGGRAGRGLSAGEVEPFL